ncbi:hypothetical protein [Anaerosporobacter sp.]|uniref:hypothetical protein n=1 Tax=Anaerosporobacter sp. TaxID=1872529 RepID=UPI00286F5D53|nr:hypothetical protein [Anaerosporobacter sp.]
MENVIDIIKDKKKIFWIIVILINIVFSFGMFPLNSNRDSFLYYLLTFVILGGLYAVLITKVIYIQILNCLSFLVGLLIRYMVEYGEHTIETKFTINNMLIMLGVVPICILAISMLWKAIIKHSIR